MEKLSRVKKYAQLREELMNDAESQLSTSELSPFAERLNRIDAAQFEKMDAEVKQEHDPVHLRREAYFDPEEKKEKLEDTASSTFNNEFLDEYINEVKQYNKERGYLSSENTANNILGRLKKEANFKEIESLKDLALEPSFEETTEIPAFGFNNEEASTISMEVKNLLAAGEEKESAEKKAEPQDKPEEASIASFAEKPLTFIPAMDEPMALPQEEERISSVEEELRKEKELREKLMNETVQMRAQLDGYDKELNDVNDSVMYANRILNVVLVVLILAMLIVGGILVYWILLDRGVI